MAASGCQVLPGGDQGLPDGDQVLPGVTRCDQVKCFGVTELQKLSFGVMGVPEIVFWHYGSCQNIVLA